MSRPALTPAASEAVRLHESILGWNLRQARRYLARGNLELALRWCTWAGQVLWWDPRCALMACPDMEAICLEVARRLPPRPLPAARVPGPRRWLHVLTQGYLTGGHTALVSRWIASEADADQHSVVSLEQEGPLPDGLFAAVRRTGGEVRLLDPKLPLVRRAEVLREQSAAGYDVVVLHTHPFDAAAVAALGQPGGPPVIVLNHADHVTWVGVSVADLVLSIRPLAAEWARLYRGARRNALLPIPLAPPGPAVTAAGRLQARQDLGITPDECVLLSIGNRTKFPPVSGVDYLSVAEAVLKEVPKVRLLVVGPADDPRWTPAQERFGGRLRVFPATPHLDPFYRAADVYLDPIPMGSLTSILESGQRAMPCVLGPRSSPYPLYPEDGALAVLPRPETVADAVRQVAILAADPAERLRLGRQFAEAVAAHHEGEGWRRHLALVKAALPTEHQVVPLVSAQPAPAEYAEFWVNATGHIDAPALLRMALSEPVHRHMGPRLDRRMARAALRATAAASHASLAAWQDAITALDLYENADTTLERDEGQGFTAEGALRLPVCPASVDFRLAFDLTGRASPRAFQWRPVVYRACRVKLTRVTFRDAAGRRQALDPASLVSNGVAADGGWVRFETCLPTFHIPAHGGAVRLILAGEWRIESRVNSTVHEHLVHEGTRQRLRSMEASRTWRMLGPVRKVAGLVRRAG